MKADAEHCWGLGAKLRRVHSSLCESWAGTGRQHWAHTCGGDGTDDGAGGGKGGMGTVVLGQELSVAKVPCAREPPACTLL